MLTYDLFMDDQEDREKFLRIYTTHRAAMYLAANAVLGDYWMADDAVQEASLKIIRNLHKIDESDLLRTRGFVAKVARNVALTMRKEMSKEIPTLDDEMAELFPPNTETPESIILDQEMSDHLHDLLSTMTEEHQEILDMVYLNGFKVGKAAELLGLSGDVARKRLQRAKAALKKRLLQEF